MSALTDEIRADARILVNELFAFARKMLVDHGEFLPFAYAINRHGELEMFGATTGTNQQSAIELSEMLEVGLRAAARDGKIRAAGLCENVTITNEGKQISALQIWTEHAVGPTAITLWPYIIADIVRFGKAKSQPAQRKIFESAHSIQTNDI